MMRLRPRATLPCDQTLRLTSIFWKPKPGPQKRIGNAPGSPGRIIAQPAECDRAGLMQSKPVRFLFRSILAVGFFALAGVFAQPPKISEDRELKEFDLTGWNCLNRLEGSAKTPDGVERNRLKNRAALNLATAQVKAMDTTTFMTEVAAFDAETKRKRRQDLSAA